MSEIRENPLTGEGVIIAPERARRGGDLAPAAYPAGAPAFLETCPFCPGNESASPGERYRINDAGGRWSLRSVVNKFSVLSPTGEVAPAGQREAVEGTVNGVGLHEVLVESPRHDLTAALYPLAHVEQVLEGYCHRFREFYADPRVRHVIVFKNHGADAGASQGHPHSQIVGIPIVPGQVRERINRCGRFFESTGQCLGCTLIGQECARALRIVAENADFVAFVPFAALSPYHLWIFPKSHAACFSDRPALPALAEVLRAVLGKVYGLLANPPFNLVLRSLGPEERGSPAFHWYLSIVPRVNRTAGFELGTGMYVNPSDPDASAEALRNYAVPSAS